MVFPILVASHEFLRVGTGHGLVPEVTASRPLNLTLTNVFLFTP
jgi:hypothetical protein